MSDLISHGGCALMKFVRSQQAFDSSVANEMLCSCLRARPLLELVLLETVHGEGLAGAEGAQATERWPSNSTDSAHLPRQVT